MKNKKKLKSILIVFLSVCAFVAFLLSPLFNLKNIDIVGASFYSDEEIKISIEELNDKNYFVLLFTNTPFSHLDYMFKGRLYDCEQKLLSAKPYLKSAEISFSFPMKATIKVEERIPVFLTKNGDEYLLVDSEGYVVEAFSSENKPAYPVIEGVETLDYKVGGSLVGMGTDTQLELAMKICNGMNQLEITKETVDIVDVSNPDRIWMFVQPSLSICFGNEKDLNVKLSVLKEIFEEGYNGDSDGVIDFTNGKNPIFKKNTHIDNVVETEDVLSPDSEGEEDIMTEESLLNDTIVEE